jgi:hypothetical protein
MAAWRRRAIELFPDLHQELQDVEFTPYLLFFELLPLARTAHESDNTSILKNVYAFAEWCMCQNATDLWNAAGVCFYEHLFDGSKRGWPKVVPWISPKIIRECWPLWEARLDLSDIAALRHLINNHPLKGWDSGLV